MTGILFIPVFLRVFAGVFGACMSGDLAGVKEILPYVPEAVNELMNEEGDNLLMWYVPSASILYNAVLMYTCLC